MRRKNPMLRKLSPTVSVTPRKLAAMLIYLSGVLAIIAGADTTASAMSSLLYFLLADEQCMRRVQDEVDRVYPEGEDPLDSSKHGELKYLNACMYVSPLPNK